MRRVLMFAGAVGVTALAAIGAGCGSSGSTDASTTPGTGTGAEAVIAACTGKIGVIAPFTGTDESDGIQMNWARVSLDNFNREHGTDFQIEPMDSTQGVPQVKAAARALAADNEVVGVVGPHTSDFVAAAGPILDAAKLVYVSPSATNVALADGRLKGFYRVVANDSVQAPTIGRVALDDLKGKKVAILDNPDPYSTGLADGVEAYVKKAGVPVARQEISIAAKDYTDVINRIPADTDVVVLSLTSPDAGQRIVQQMKKKGRDPAFIGGDALFVLDRFNPVGAYVVSFTPDLRKSEAGGAVVRLYKAVFGSLATFGGPAFGAMQAVATAALHTCKDGRASRDGVWDALPATKIKDSVLGQDIKFTKDHELKGGRFYVYRIGPDDYQALD
jgi:branched-chain amino acid transport system substrate-binding protein